MSLTKYLAAVEPGTKTQLRVLLSRWIVAGIHAGGCMEVITTKLGAGIRALETGIRLVFDTCSPPPLHL